MFRFIHVKFYLEFPEGKPLVDLVTVYVSEKFLDKYFQINNQFPPVIKFSLLLLKKKCSHIPKVIYWYIFLVLQFHKLLATWSTTCAHKAQFNFTTVYLYSIKGI